MSRSINWRRSGGFTLIEVMIATAILVIGVSAMALLAAVMLTRGRQSKYMNIASTLASEKLEDLNRWNENAQAICVQPGDTSEGSLSTPVTNNISCTGETPNSINYYDDININFASSSNCGNAGNGCFAETVSSTTAGVTTYYTTYHAPSGVIPGNSDGNTPFTSTISPGAMTFHRTWLIEANTPVTGTRRITVLVQLNDQSVKPSVQFQMSLVRQ
jgi:prepilin-type N-terminal cleavage/methylation domain-containing protein